jgi:DNA-binding transcriptional ArsR family regulator
MTGATPTADDEDRVFRALADPSRRAIFQALSHGPQTVKALTARFELSQPAVSQHLGVLKAAGLVQGHRAGREVTYRVDGGGLKPLIDWVSHYRAFWLEHVERLERLLEQME